MKLERLTIAGANDAPDLTAEISVPDLPGAHVQTTLVLMAHDIPYGERDAHDNLFGFLRVMFNKEGYHTLTFDFESCGDSDGREEEFTLDRARENLDRVMSFARERGFDHFIFVGSGAACALLLERSDETTRMAFLFWPAVDLASHAKSLFYEQDGKTLIAKGRRIGMDLVRGMEAYDPSRALKSIRLPVLIQYGALDDFVGRDQIDRIKKDFNALRIDITSYSDGCYGLTDPRHRQMMAHHIRSFLHKYA